MSHSIEASVLLATTVGVIDSLDRLFPFLRALIPGYTNRRVEQFILEAAQDNAPKKIADLTETLEFNLQKSLIHYGEMNFPLTIGQGPFFTEEELLDILVHTIALKGIFLTFTIDTDPARNALIEEYEKKDEVFRNLRQAVQEGAKYEDFLNDYIRIVTARKLVKKYNLTPEMAQTLLPTPEQFNFDPLRLTPAQEEKKAEIIQSLSLPPVVQSIAQQTVTFGQYTTKGFRAVALIAEKTYNGGTSAAKKLVETLEKAAANWEALAIGAGVLTLLYYLAPAYGAYKSYTADYRPSIRKKKRRVKEE